VPAVVTPTTPLPASPSLLGALAEAGDMSAVVKAMEKEGIG
jgi:hypothetical protein